MQFARFVSVCVSSDRDYKIGNEYSMTRQRGPKKSDCETFSCVPGSVFSKNRSQNSMFKIVLSDTQKNTL